MSQAAAGREYLAIAAAANMAIRTVQAKFKAAGNSTTAAELAAYAQPAQAALSRSDGKLAELARDYPGAAHDIRSLVAADQALIQDLATTSSLTASNVQQWQQSIAGGLSKLSGAVAVVRGDLGLPQKS